MASRGTQLDQTAPQSSEDELTAVAEKLTAGGSKPHAYRALQRGRHDEAEERLKLFELDPQW